MKEAIRNLKKGRCIVVKGEIGPHNIFRTYIVKDTYYNMMSEFIRYEEIIARALQEHPENSYESILSQLSEDPENHKETYQIIRLIYLPAGMLPESKTVQVMSFPNLDSMLIRPDENSITQEIIDDFCFQIRSDAEWRELDIDCLKKEANCLYHNRCLLFPELDQAESKCNSYTIKGSLKQKDRKYYKLKEAERLLKELLTLGSPEAIKYQKELLEIQEYLKEYEKY